MDGSTTTGSPTSAARRSAASWHPATLVSLSAGLTILAFWPHAQLSAALLAPAVLVAIAAGVALGAGPAAAVRWRRWTLAAWLPVALSLVVVHGLVFPEGRDVLWRLGPLAVTVEGLSFAAARAARWLAVAAAVALVGAICRPAALAEALETGPLPGGLGHAAAAALLLLPAARRNARQIREAQRARGLAVNGSPWRRARSLAPLVVPLAVSLIVDGQDRALSLAARGYVPGRPMSRFAPLCDTRRQRIARRIGLAVVLAAAVLARLGAAAR